MVLVMDTVSFIVAMAMQSAFVVQFLCATYTSGRDMIDLYLIFFAEK